MRVVAWQNACKQGGGDRGLARLRQTMATAPSAAERSFGIHHNYIERPWGPGGASPG
jgi:hypothetical protein